MQQVEEEAYLKEQMESNQLSTIKSQENEVNSLLQKIKEKETMALQQNKESVSLHRNVFALNLCKPECICTSFYITLMNVISRIIRR